MSSGKKDTKLQHTAASQCASAISTILLYPLDVVRMRFMSQDGSRARNHNAQYYKSILSSFRVIAKEEGKIRPFYSGCHVAVLGSVCAWGVYMYAYRWQCALYNNYVEARQGVEGSILSQAASLGTLLQRFGFSVIASCTSALVCNPIWVIKTRMQLEEFNPTMKAEGKVAHYGTFRGGVLHAVRVGGVRSLWSGVSAQLLLGVPMAFNLPLYDTIKASVLRYREVDKLNTVEAAFCSFVARTLLMVVSHPIVVVKTRLQDHRANVGDVQYNRLLQSFRTVYTHNGLKGFYRGMVPSLVQAVPRSVLTFVLYEKFLNLFNTPN
ncbi:solute carrier family 25 (mitochondrial folate transporter), member 32 [Angomonas deanei]|nr:solute carrier family 25 (mitochondrial folate transporter), member 32 [Angomonas deanei]|eukprot:EPY30686.1 solute carrier family 25 (mitochondrial folate transporter), member 32 [Angomonas deanei]